MKLLSLHAKCYRCLRDQDIPLRDLNVFIGANASGKSSILDVLRFLQEGIHARDFREPVSARGGIIHLAWKGEDAHRIDIKASFEESDSKFEWSISLERDEYEFSVEEQVTQLISKLPPMQLLKAKNGEGWWWSGERQQVQLKQTVTSCALAAAAADAAFPARTISDFVSGWGFFDPSPFSLRRGWPGMESTRLDPYGRNLAQRLFALKQLAPSTFGQLIAATQSVLGLPTELEPRESEGRYYFAQKEPGLLHWVHQIGTSSGTLRMLALMTALFDEQENTLVGIEEPENHVHPTALSAFAEYLLEARSRRQILVTTHSPLLLDFLDEPSAVYVVRRDAQEGTRVFVEAEPKKIRRALQESGFGLGEFYETKGFGG